jgi:S-layer protein
LVDSVTAANTTLTALDSINGGNGNDVLRLNLIGAATALPSVTISNIETINVRASANIGTVGVNDLLNDANNDNDATPTVAYNFSSAANLTALNVTQATSASVKAATTTDVSVSGVTGSVEVDGGKTITVASAAADSSITVGSKVAAAADNTNTAGTAAAGAVTVTHTSQGSGAILVDGGTNVVITSSGVSTGGTTVGSLKASSGSVNVTSTGAATTAGTDVALGAISVTGGTTVNVTQVATSSGAAAADDATGATVTQGAVTVNGDAKTTAVTVTQSAAVAEVVYAAAGAAGTLETAVVTFADMVANETVIINGLTFTAAVNMTGAEVAAAFANLTSGGFQANGGTTSKGVYTGTNTAGWTSGSVVTTDGVSKVTYTATTEGNQTDLDVNDGTTDPTVVTTNGSGNAATEATTGVLGVVGGAVSVTDNGDDKITTVTLSGFGAGSTISSDALTSLSLASSNADVTVTNAVATTLGLTVDGVGISTNTGVVDIGSTYTTLNLTATGTNSVIDLTAAGVVNLTVAGTKSVNLSGTSTLTALETIKVTGSAGLTIDGDTADTLTDVDASGTSGAVTAIIGADTTTYEGSSGVDSLTLDSTTITEAVSLNAGDDSLTLAAGTTSSTGVLDGGTGIDTLVMDSADAEGASATTTFETKITNFDKLSLNAVVAAATDTINLANLDDISYVKSAGAVATAQKGTITFAGTESDGADEVLTTTITDAGGTATFTTTVTASTAATATTTAVSAVTYNVTGTSSQTYTVTEAAGVVTITAGTANTAFTAATVSTTHGNTTDITAGAYAAVTAAAAAGSLVLTHMGNNGTLEVSGDSSGATVTMDDATGTADSFNILVKASTGKAAGTVTVAGVETVTVTSTDSDTTTANASHSLTLTAAAAKTVNMLGNTQMTLTLTGSNAVTLVDGSNATGKVIVGTASTAAAAATVKGGTAADTLTANHASDVLQGGAGADTLVVNAGLVTLTGGAGADTFNVAYVVSNSNTYATITDLAAGDKLKFAANASDFYASKVVLGDTAVFQDYANEAVNLTDAGDVSWFQYGGNTYVVYNASNGASFTNNSDSIVKITGLFDLSTSNFSTSNDTLVIA